MGAQWGETPGPRRPAPARGGLPRPAICLGRGNLPGLRFALAAAAGPGLRFARPVAPGLARDLPGRCGLPDPARGAPVEFLCHEWYNFNKLTTVSPRRMTPARQPTMKEGIS